MPAMVTCPSCGTKLPVSEAARSRPARCYKCGTVFSSPDTAPPVRSPEPEAEEATVRNVILPSSTAAPAAAPEASVPVPPLAPRRKGDPAEIAARAAGQVLGALALGLAFAAVLCLVTPFAFWLSLPVSGLATALGAAGLWLSQRLSPGYGLCIGGTALGALLLLTSLALVVARQQQLQQQLQQLDQLFR